ncbi:MAG: DUF4089 domain-containing protein [Burkholderiales bacterium]|jgi:hypothetical protein|nr:DUF4089 domain-containing protein [Burkholderiales bacterium]
MTADETTAYVEVVAGAQGFALSAEQITRVAAIFARTAEMAELLMEFDLPESAEPAPLFRP